MQIRKYKHEIEKLI